jgi:TonB family protein
MGSTFSDRWQKVTPVSAPGMLAAEERSQELLQHFALRELPFGVTPNPSFLFSSRMHRAALQSMIQSIELNLGFTVLLGEPGTGKTTLLLQLLTQYRDSARTAFIFQTQGRRFDLLRFLVSELELPDSNGDEVLLHQRLREMLVNEARAGRKVLVIVDEAQNLNQTSLEAVRLLSDFETASSKLLHIILAGSARLGETLQDPDLLPLAQRIMTICRLEPFTPEEVKDYVIFRLETAGSKMSGKLFSAGALAAIAEETGGVPRLINSVCYRALSAAFARRERQVTTRMVRQAARDLDLSARGLGFNLTSAEHPVRTENQNIGTNFFSVSDKEEEPGAGGTGLDLDEGFPAVNGKQSGEHPEFWPVAQSSVTNHHPAQSAPSSLIASSSPPRDNPIPIATRRYKHSLAKTMNVNGIAGHGPGGPGLFAFFKSVRMKTDRATALVAVLIAIALVLSAAMFKLRSNVSDTAATPNPVVTDSIAHAPAVRAPGVPALSSTDSKARNDNSSSLVSGLPRETAQSLSAGTNVEKAGRRMATVPAFETLPQTELPSRINRQSPGPKEATTLPEPELISNLSHPSNLALPSAVARPIVPKFAAAAVAAPADARDAIPRRAIKVVQPEYPEMAKIRRIGGVVLLELEVDASGKVQRVHSVGGNSLLTDAAEAAARQWQYSPAPNQTVPSVILLQFNFNLNSQGK